MNFKQSKTCLNWCEVHICQDKSCIFVSVSKNMLLQFFNFLFWLYILFFLCLRCWEKVRCLISLFVGYITSNYFSVLVQLNAYKNAVRLAHILGPSGGIFMSFLSLFCFSFVRSVSLGLDLMILMTYLLDNLPWIHGMLQFPWLWYTD